MKRHRSLVLTFAGAIALFAYGCRKPAPPVTTTPPPIGVRGVGSVYANPRYSIEVKLPPGWKYREQPADPAQGGTFLELDTGSELQGTLGVMTGGVDLKTLAGNITAGLSQKVRELESQSEQPWSASGLRRELRYVTPVGRYRHSMGLRFHDGRVYLLQVLGPDREWIRRQLEVDRIFNEIVFAPVKHESVPKGSPRGPITWSSPRWGFEVSLPSDWSFQDLKEAEGPILARFWTSKGMPFGHVMLFRREEPCLTLAEALAKQASPDQPPSFMRKSGGETGAVLAYRNSIGGVDYMTHLKILMREGTRLVFMIWCEASDYDQIKAGFAEAEGSFQVLPP